MMIRKNLVSPTERTALNNQEMLYRTYVVGALQFSEIYGNVL